MLRFTLALAVAGLALTACDADLATPQQTDVAVPAAPAATAPAQEATPTAAPPVEQVDRATIKYMLYQAAIKHGVNAGLVMAVGWWESGWNQAAVSVTGAVGIMQVEPATARVAGQVLLHRTADPHVLADNIDLGVAILREDLDRYNNDLSKSLVAYYEGPLAVKEWAQLDAGAQAYVWGVYRLAVRFDQGTGPA